MLELHEHLNIEAHKTHALGDMSLGHGLTHERSARHPVEMFLLFYEHLTFLSFHQFCDRLPVLVGGDSRIIRPTQI